MRTTLDKAIAGKFETPPSREEWPEDVERTIRESNSAGQERPSVSSTESRDGADWKTRAALLRSYPVYASIPAGGFGSMPTQIASRLETDRVLIGDVPHYVVNLRGGKVIELRTHEQYVAVRVKGESLNLSNIKEGDYVLLQIQEDAANGDIAAVMILSDTPDEEKCSLKHFARKEGKIILSPNSSNPNYKAYEFFEEDKKVVVQGVALAVLKRIPE